MKKYLFGLSTAIILVLSGCTAKNGVGKNTQGGSEISPTGTGITGLNHKDLLTETTIHDAVRAQDMKLVEFYISEKIDLNEKDMLGYTPLHLAARFNHLDIAEKLISNGAGVDNLDNYGDTPLLDSTRNGYTQMSKLLICSGAKRDVVDKYGMSPLHYASKTKDEPIANLLRSENIQEACSKVELQPVVENFIDLIAIDDYSVINDNTPEICGDIKTDEVKEVNLTVSQNQAVLANIDYETKRWCANISEELVNGEHIAEAIAVDNAGEKGKASDNFEVYVLNDLYTALNNEFSPDFEKWNAELEKDTLTFRFKNPSLMFNRGSSEISDNYKEILDDFFPRYINIIKDYSSDIMSVNVQGHTSSRYRSAATAEEKFRKNEILSQKRADEVLSYVKEITNPIVEENKMFVDKTFVAEGKSSSVPILNEDGTENLELSRRVEFKIVTSPNN